MKMDKLINNNNTFEFEISGAEKCEKIERERDLYFCCVADLLFVGRERERGRCRECEEGKKRIERGVYKLYKAVHIIISRY